MRARPVLLLAGVAGAAAVLIPDLLGVDGRQPMLATVAWRPQALVGAALGAVVLSTRRSRRPAAAVLGAVTAVGVTAIAARTPHADRVAPGPHDLTILGLNVFSGQADTGAVAALIGREAPDLVVLPE